MTKEQKFYGILSDIFVGAKVEGESGYINLSESGDEKVDYIKHIIKTPSEVRFVNDLEDYLVKSDNKFKEFDWWMFSK